MLCIYSILLWHLNIILLWLVYIILLWHANIILLSHVTISKFDANLSRGSWVMIGQINKQKTPDNQRLILYKYRWSFTQYTQVQFQIYLCTLFSSILGMRCCWCGMTVCTLNFFLFFPLSLIISCYFFANFH